MNKKLLGQIHTKMIMPLSAFTLAEVLVVVAMIGMIADLLMPELVENYREQLAITQLKRVYAVTANAYESAVKDNGTPDNWGLSDSGNPAGLQSLNNIMSQNMKVSKNCGTDAGCFPESDYKNITGNTTEQSPNLNTDSTKIMLPDGTSMSFAQLDANCDLNWGNTKALSSVCGTIGVDINGLKGPNTYGEDYFGFVITKYGIIPMGTPAQTAYSFDGFCNNANMSSENGLSCSAWALYNDNMDYKDCVGLNWNGQSSCKEMQHRNRERERERERICSGKNDDNNDNNGNNNKNFKNGNDNEGNNGNNNCNGNY